MTLRLVCCLLFVVLSVSDASAQVADVPGAAMFRPPSPAAGRPGLRELHADRVSFVEKMYQLNNKQVGEIRPMLDQMLRSQERYEAMTCLTLHRMRIAISLVANDAGSSDAHRARTIARFQEQVSGIRARAPMSLANVMKRVEPLLPEEQVQAAHARIRAYLEARLKLDAANINLTKIDSLLAEPVLPGALPEMPKPAEASPEREKKIQVFPKRHVAETKPEIAAPPTDDRARARPPKAKSPTTISPETKPKQRRPTPSPEPRKPLKPAPPESEWRHHVDSAAAKYGFTDAQRQVAERVLAGCQTRASAHRERSKAAYEQVMKKMAEPAKRQEEVKKLNYRLDRLYDELTQRVDSIATIEQRFCADEGKPPPKHKPKAAPKRGQPKRAVTKEDLSKAS